MNDIKVIVIGSLNTDMIGTGFERILGPGELTTGQTFSIGLGGKSRNIAEMSACLLKKWQVAMLGRTVKDKFGLWKMPFYALQKSGVITKYIKFLTKGLPGIALIPVDTKERNQIYVLPGVNNDFSPSDILAVSKIFSKARVMTLSLELPKRTAIAAIKEANKYDLKVILDTGGINENADNKWILKQKIFILRPNEHETKILTGVRVIDYKSAAKAAKKILNKNIENLLITAGKNGGYFFNTKMKKHLRVPFIKKSKFVDETGCGDQVTSVITAAVAEGTDIYEACVLVILAGTIQFYKKGIIPVTKYELEKFRKYF